MPDETPQQPPQTSVDTPATQATPTDGLSELERLVAEAEQAATVPVTDHPKPCEHIQVMSGIVYTKCPTCLWMFCDLCASVLDPKYCRLCLPVAEGEFKTDPLIDEDGVTHEGRVMHMDPNSRFFQPRFGTLARCIADMRDNDLEEYIKYYQDLVHQAERALDFRRVVLGSAQLESSQRADTRRRQLRADKTKFPVKILTVAKDGSGKKKTASADAMLKMLEALKQLQKNRAAKAAANAATVVAKKETPNA